MRRLIALWLFLATAPAFAQDATVTVETSADRLRTLTHEVVVPAAPDDVWQAVATVEGWQTWAVPVARTIPGTDRFETNYDRSAPPGSPGSIEQQWLVRDPPHAVSFRTTRTPVDFPHAAAYRNVVSTFTFAPAGPNRTRVRLIGSGYPAGPEGDALVAFFRSGNSIALRQLHRRFVSGPINWTAPNIAEEGERNAGN